MIFSRLSQCSITRRRELVLRLGPQAATASRLGTCVAGPVHDGTLR
jgi:hypothetical protein